jgi:glycosyltransferase involved in cell wall biosynthesis
MREGIELQPTKQLPPANLNKPTLLSFGAVRPMKRTLDIVRAFEFAKTSIPALKLVIAGGISDPYAQKVQKAIEASPYKKDIAVLGPVPEKEKRELMLEADVLAAASVKEGWGLIITEANSQGTPVVAYDADGQRDSIQNGKTGIITQPNPRALGEGIAILLKNKKRYEKIREAAWHDSMQYTFDTSYRDFLRLIDHA